MSHPAGSALMEPIGQPAKARFGRRKWDKQPSQSAAVLIATVGVPIPPSAIRNGVKLSGGKPVAVVSIARIYGSSLGLPNPGLMPTKKEMDEQRAQVAKAISRLERAGVEAWGQVAATRRYAKTIAGAAKARGVDHVLVVTPEAPHWRKVIEGDVARDVRRRLPKEVTVESVTV
ncbi:MAG TPA: universal stress protein [Acidimicrobiales bacterium]|jgi:nucleotide-binding universal stress UspA family protein|nr:universal stress protein [Acidimicrobiales bacterium]